MASCLPEQADAGVTGFHVLPVCVYSCSSLVFCVSPSESFCVPCFPFHPSLSFSLSGCPHFLPTCISVSDNLIGFHTSHPFFPEPPKRNPFLSAFNRGLKDFCLINMQSIQKTFLSMFPIQTSQGEQGREAKKPIKVSSQTNVFLALLPKRRNGFSFKNTLLSSFEGNMPKF